LQEAAKQTSLERGQNSIGKDKTKMVDSVIRACQTNDQDQTFKSPAERKR